MAPVLPYQRWPWAPHADCKSLSCGRPAVPSLLIRGPVIVEQKGLTCVAVALLYGERERWVCGSWSSVLLALLKGAHVSLGVNVSVIWELGRRKQSCSATRCWQRGGSYSGLSWGHAGGGAGHAAQVWMSWSDSPAFPHPADAPFHAPGALPPHHDSLPPGALPPAAGQLSGPP